jgi:hypothetical protein
MQEQPYINLHAAPAGNLPRFNVNADTASILTNVQSPPRPRRRLKDTSTDKCEGLDALIQKTKAVSIEQQNFNLGQDEGEGYNFLYSADPRQQIEGAIFFRRYVCGEGSEQRAHNMISWNILERLLFFLRPGMVSDDLLV